MIYHTLYDWQKKIIDTNKEKQAFGLFLDCGLGKTPLSLAFAESNACDKVLIITINSKAIEDSNTSGSWWEWASKSNIPYRIQNKLTFKSPINTDLLILNYESLFERNTKSLTLKKNVADFIKNCKGHNFALIIDESHKMKNLQSLQTKAIMMIQRLAKLYSNKCYTYLLSGTPFTTGYEDLYSQLKCLEYEETKTSFIDTFCIRDHRRGLLEWQQPIIGYKNIDKLYDLVHQYAVTIKSKDVLDLPEQVFVNHVSSKSDEFDFLTLEELPGDIIHKELVNRRIPDDTGFTGHTKQPNPFYRNLDYPAYNYLAETPGALWLRARQISIGFQGNAEECIWYDRNRLKELERFLEQNEDNYVLFYNYTPEMIELYEICDRLGYNIDVYCGEVKSMVFYEKYSGLSESERLHSKKNIILANFASGSTGMNWQLYNKCILFSLPLYKDWEQGLKRVHRIGQKEMVVYHIFYQANWLDIGMKRALEEKIQYTEDMFQDEHNKNKGR